MVMIPLGLHVKIDIKRNIADGKFIHMSDLPKKDSREALEQLCFNLLVNLVAENLQHLRTCENAIVECIHFGCKITDYL